MVGQLKIVKVLASWPLASRSAPEVWFPPECQQSSVPAAAQRAASTGRALSTSPPPGPSPCPQGQVHSPWMLNACLKHARCALQEGNVCTIYIFLFQTWVIPFKSWSMSKKLPMHTICMFQACFVNAIVTWSIIIFGYTFEFLIIPIPPLLGVSIMCACWVLGACIGWVTTCTVCVFDMDELGMIMYTNKIVYMGSESRKNVSLQHAQASIGRKQGKHEKCMCFASPFHLHDKNYYSKNYSKKEVCMVCA